MSSHYGKTNRFFVFLLALRTKSDFHFKLQLHLMNISLLNQAALMTFLRERLVISGNVFNLFVSVLFSPLFPVITKYVL